MSTITVTATYVGVADRFNFVPGQQYTLSIYPFENRPGMLGVGNTAPPNQVLPYGSWPAFLSVWANVTKVQPVALTTAPPPEQPATAQRTRLRTVIAHTSDGKLGWEQVTEQHGPSTNYYYQLVVEGKETAQFIERGKALNAYAHLLRTAFYKEHEPIRASGDAICSQCGSPYKAHPFDTNELYHGTPYLNLLCDGTRIKL